MQSVQDYSLVILDNFLLEDGQVYGYEHWIDIRLVDNELHEFIKIIHLN